MWSVCGTACVAKDTLCEVPVAFYRMNMSAIYSHKETERHTDTSACLKPMVRSLLYGGYVQKHTLFSVSLECTMKGLTMAFTGWIFAMPP